MPGRRWQPQNRLLIRNSAQYCTFAVYLGAYCEINSWRFAKADGLIVVPTILGDPNAHLGNPNENPSRDNGARLRGRGACAGRA